MKIPNPFLFVAAMCRTGYARLRGYQILVTPLEAEERYLTCCGCPFLKRNDWVEDQCSICSCFVDSKVLLAMEECPKKKWLRVWKRRTI